MPTRPKASARTQARRSPAARLQIYRDKRRFERTPEPSGDDTRAKAASTELSYVIQKHAARALHYDFRLELGGVLLSWSVPKGPSLQAGARRLAVRTEDHPLDYAQFEGVIPKGEYGGGTVLLWDRGTWVPEEDPKRGLARGRLNFELHGEKLRGRFHLVRTRLDAGKRENWLLFKGRDAEADDSRDVLALTQSVASGRTLEEIEANPDDVWHSDSDPKEAPPPTAATKRARKATATKATAKPKATDQAHDTIALVKQLELPFALTNLEKLLYPEAGLRKADVIAYYAAVHPLILPHLADRPLTLVRCPNGPAGQCFFQKHKNKGVPECVHGVAIQEGGKREEYMFVSDLPGLLALAQLGALELHTWGCHAADPEHPDKLVFDLDPSPELSWDSVVDAAVELRMRLNDIGLQSFVQTTGGKGLHVIAPLEPQLSWDEHKQVSLQIVQAMAEEQPELYLTSMRKSLRKGRIFLDYLRNGRGATAIAPYSTRARPHATVATPLTWDELMDGVDPQQFTLRSIPSRISQPRFNPWPKYNKRQHLSARALRSLPQRTG